MHMLNAFGFVQIFFSIFDVEVHIRFCPEILLLIERNQIII
jgi:hypothetical protein